MTGAPRVGAVVLAAGGSSRMGSPKQLIVHHGEPLVARAARIALVAGADPVVIVLGAEADAVSRALSENSRIRTVVNPRWETGIASSLAAGLGALGSDASGDGAMVVLADQPLVDVESLQTLIAAFAAGSRVVASGYAGTVGVPAIFGSEHFPALMRLEGDAGAGNWLRSRLSEVTVIPLEGAAFDLDTPSDSARLAGTGNPG